MSRGAAHVLDVVDVRACNGEQARILFCKEDGPFGMPRLDCDQVTTQVLHATSREFLFAFS